MIGGERAEDWLARMEAPGAEQHREAFELWHRDPANAAAYAALRRDFDRTTQVSVDQVAALARAHDAARRKEKQRWAIAATILLSLSAGFAWVTMSPGPGDTRIAQEAATGGRSLDDGTLVALSDGSRIETRFTPDERIVTLSGGHALFTVAHDASRPFRVVAGGSVTTALGTIFEVDLLSAAPRIHLIQGSVEVAVKSGDRPALRLAPGESAEVSFEGPQRVPTTASPVVARKIDADRTKLGTILTSANAVNSQKIGLADPALANLLVSGRFEIDDGEALARKLAAALGLVVISRPDSLVLARP
jgi:Fe2+-dicitrate sensor, membrane component